MKPHENETTLNSLTLILLERYNRLVKKEYRYNLPADEFTNDVSQLVLSKFRKMLVFNTIVHTKDDNENKIIRLDYDYTTTGKFIFFNAGLIGGYINNKRLEIYVDYVNKFNKGNESDNSPYVYNEFIDNLEDFICKFHYDTPIKGFGFNNEAKFLNYRRVEFKLKASDYQYSTCQECWQSRKGISY